MNKLRAFSEWFNEKMEPRRIEDLTEEELRRWQHTERDTNILLLIGMIIYIPIAFLMKLVSLNK